jgi:hypothetical protein
MSAQRLIVLPDAVYGCLADEAKRQGTTVKLLLLDLLARAMQEFQQSRPAQESLASRGH